MRAFTCQRLSIKKKKSFYYTMLFSSSDLKELSKNLVILFASYSAGFLAGGLIRKVIHNEEDIQRLYSLLKRRENESELKK